MRLFAVAAALALLAGSAPAVVPPAAATARAASGQVYEGFIIAPGDVHSFLLEDFAPMPVSIALKAGKGSTLLPDIALFDPAEADITGTLAAFRKDGAKSVAVKNAPGIALPGRYVLQVKGKTGSTGSYLLKVSAKAVKSFKGTGFVVDPNVTTFSVFAPTESLVTVKVVKASGSVLVPELRTVDGPPCAITSLVRSATPGLGAFVAPLTGDWEVGVAGDGGTGGGFNWVAKVKPAKPSKKPVRVNGGAPFFAEPGPAGGILTASAGQTVFGFGADPLGLCWREVRTTGGGPNGGKNSVQAATLKGGGLPALANNFVTDPTPDPLAFGLGPTHAALFDFAGADLYAIARNGDGETVLSTTLGTVDRVLVNGDYAFALKPDAIRRYALDGSDPGGILTDAANVHEEMAVGGLGVVYAAENPGGDLIIETVDEDGGGDTTLATIASNPGILALCARGPDVYFAVNNGLDGASLFRASLCDPGQEIPLCPDFGAPVRAMAVDDQNVYALEEDAEDGVRLRQIPRGGGESFVLFRSDGASFEISITGVAAAGGYVYVVVDDGGKDAFYRVKRR